MSAGQTRTESSIAATETTVVEENTAVVRIIFKTFNKMIYFY